MKELNTNKKKKPEDNSLEGTQEAEASGSVDVRPFNLHHYAKKGRWLIHTSYLRMRGLPEPRQSRASCAT